MVGNPAEAEGDEGHVGEVCAVGYGCESWVYYGCGGGGLRGGEGFGCVGGLRMDCVP